MARADLISFLRSQKSSPMEFNWNMLIAPNLYSLVTQQDIFQLYKIATSLKYNGNVEAKYAAIDNVLARRGFKRLGRGTNRIVYKYLEDERFVLKVAMDKVALTDNLREYENQLMLKPFVTKIFQVSPCGTVAVVERVTPITSREEFKAIAEDVFDLLVNCIIGKYVLEDIGEKFFMNYGIRCNAQGSFGPVLLDYPYVYPLDGRKLKCCAFNIKTGKICGGEIDYDVGFNNLYCTCCGKQYFARDLQNPEQNNMKIIRKGSGIDMKITIKRGDQIISQFNTLEETSRIERRKRKRVIPNKRPIVNITFGDEDPQEEINNVKEAVQEKVKEENNNSQPQVQEPMTKEEAIEKSNAIVEEAIAKFKESNGEPLKVENEDIKEEEPIVEEKKEKPLTPEQMAIQMIEEQEKQQKNNSNNPFKNEVLNQRLQSNTLGVGSMEDPSRPRENKQSTVNVEAMDTFIPTDKAYRERLAKKNSFLANM